MGIQCEIVQSEQIKKSWSDLWGQGTTITSVTESFLILCGFLLLMSW